MSVYVINNDDYLATGYVTSDYVGTDSDLYVTAGYVSGVVFGEATLSSSATVSATATRIHPGQVTVTSTTKVGSSSDVNAQNHSGINIHNTVQSQPILVGTSSVTSTATTTATTGNVIRGVASLSSSATTTNTAIKTVSATIVPGSAFTSTVIASGIIAVSYTHLTLPTR